MSNNSIQKALEAAQVISFEPQQPAADWSELIPIGNSELPVKSFDPVLLPEPFRDYVADAAERISCPIDFVAVALLVVTGSVIGTACGIRPKERDDWTVIPNLWGAIVGAPTSGKSPAMDAAMCFLKELSTATSSEWQQSTRQYMAELAVYNAKKSAIEKAMKSLAERRFSKSKDSNGKYKQSPNPVVKEINEEESWSEIQKRFAELVEPDKPLSRKFSTNDITMEKLHEGLTQNRHGILVCRDELFGFIRSQEDPQRAAERAFYLQGWNGLGSYELERIGRGTVTAERICISLLGGIQPSKLYPLLASTVSGTNNDGFLQRFQLLVKPDLAEWKNVDRTPNFDARARVMRVLNKLAHIDRSTGHEALDGDIAVLRFDPDAQCVFNAWIDGLMNTKARTEKCAALGEHLSKYRRLMPALSLIFHLVHSAESGDKGRSVCVECATRATDWCDYLESHARRIYGSISSPQASAAKLAAKLSEGALPDGFTLRDVTGKDWQLLSTSDVAEPAISELITRGWLKREESLPGTVGRPTVRYRMNPKIGAKGTAT